MKIYSKIGTNLQVIQVGGMPIDCDIEMSEGRPEGDYISNDDGQWISYTPAKHYSSIEFFELFSIDELKAIYSAADNTIDLKIWLSRASGANYISNQDQSTLNGMAYLVYQSLITQARHDEILS